MSNQEPSVVVTLSVIYDKLLDIDKKVDPVPARLEDHETRLRSLERHVWSRAGLAATISGVAVVVVSKLLDGGAI